MGKVVRRINNDSARHQKAAFDGWQQCSGGRVVAMFRWRGCLAGKWSKDRLIPVSIRLGVVCVCVADSMLKFVFYFYKNRSLPYCKTLGCHVW